MTTITLAAEVRDRLAALARAHGRTMGEEVAELIEIAERGQFWADVADGYRRLRSQPEAWSAYQAELAAWESNGLEPLAATAAEEYPEYNNAPEDQ